MARNLNNLPALPHAGEPVVATGRRAMRAAPPGGFTLIELMVTIIIIGILAGVFLGALAAAQRAANVAHTQALIAKLHSQLMLRYDSYRTRRLPINSTGLTGQQAAVHRLAAIRELMRLEMPDRYSDLMSIVAGAPGAPLTTPHPLNPQRLPNSSPMVPAFFTWDPAGEIWWPGAKNRPATWIPFSAVNMSYQRRCNANQVAGEPTPPSAAFEDAECLYLIITTGMADSAMASEHISPNDIGDADGDGMPEFHDAWGNPIRYLRCAPAFFSDLQPFTATSASHHDPFDPLKLQHPYASVLATKNDLQSVPASAGPKNGLALYPLIYSAGADRSTDIQRPPVFGSGNFAGYARPSSEYYCQFLSYIPKLTNVSQQGLPLMYAKVYDPYHLQLQNVGASVDVDTTNMASTPDGEDGSADNIHNHLIGP